MATETIASYSVPEHHVIQFTANVQAELARQGGLLRSNVSVGTYNGDRAQVVNFLGPIYFQERTTAYQDTKVTEPEHTQRWISGRDFDCALLVDRLDTLRMIYDPTNPYVERMREAAARLEDDVIVASFYSAALSGKQGTTVIQFPSADVVPFDGGQNASTNASNITGSQQGMSVAKLRRARRALKERYVDLRAEKPMIAVTAAQVDDLLGEVAVGSKDYNSVQPLVDGEVSQFMGFTFVPIQDVIPTRVASTELVPGTTNAEGLVRQCPVWVKSGMHFGTWQDLVVTINNRPDKNNIKQIHGCMTLGATRVEEGKVLALECAES